MHFIVSPITKLNLLSQYTHQYLLGRIKRCNAKLHEQMVNAAINNKDNKRIEYAKQFDGNLDMFRSVKVVKGRFDVQCTAMVKEMRLTLKGLEKPISYPPFTLRQYIKPGLIITEEGNSRVSVDITAERFPIIFEMRDAYLSTQKQIDTLVEKLESVRTFSEVYAFFENADDERFENDVDDFIAMANARGEEDVSA